MPRVLIFLIVLAMMIYALVDAIQTENTRVRLLPKMVWILLILIFGAIGAVAWFFAGRPRGPKNERPGPRFPQAPRGPDDDPDFLRSL